MKVNINYKGKSVELDIPDETLEELVKEQKKTGWEKPEKSQNYWCIGYDGKPAGDGWDNWQADNERYDVGNCFTDERLAENIARYQSLDLRIRRRISEICKPLKWEDPFNLKYTILYNHQRNEIVVACRTVTQNCSWHCDSENHAKQIIEEFKDELIWFFTEFKDRMDG